MRLPSDVPHPPDPPPPQLQESTRDQDPRLSFSTPEFKEAQVGSSLRSQLIPGTELIGMAKAQGRGGAKRWVWERSLGFDCLTVHGLCIPVTF